MYSTMYPYSKNLTKGKAKVVAAGGGTFFECCTRDLAARIIKCFGKNIHLGRGVLCGVNWMIFK